MSWSMLMLMLKAIMGNGPQTDLVGFGVGTRIVVTYRKRKIMLWLLLFDVLLYF
jgi:hypothetical protein